MKHAIFECNPLEHDQLATAEDRIAAWSDWFEVERPEIIYLDGEIDLTPAMFDWIRKAKANMDWIFCGDPRALVDAYVRHAEGRDMGVREFCRRLGNLSVEERKAIVAQVKSSR